MNINEYLLLLNKHSKKFWDFVKLKSDEEKRIKPLLKRVDEEYSEKFAILEKRYNADCDALIDKKDNEKQEINAHFSFLRSRCCQETSSIMDAKQALLSNYHIDNETMCKLLSEVTQSHWKQMNITSVCINNNLFRYGFCLVNEHDDSVQNLIYVSGRDKLKDSETLIVGMDCESSSFHDAMKQYVGAYFESSSLHDAKRQEKSNYDQYNWLNDYLIAKEFLPQNFEFFGFDHFNIREHNQEPIISAIERYIANPDSYRKMENEVLSEEKVLEE